jgi:isoleucyl-tRNA synthetase
VSYQIKPNFRALGPKVGKRMPKLKQALKDVDGAALLQSLSAEGCVRLVVDGEEIELTAEEIGVTLEAKEGFAAASGGAGVVVLHTELDADLVSEGLYREVLNRIQTFRKKLDLEYTGRIVLSIEASDEVLAAVRPRVEDLARETLADSVDLGASPSTDAEVDETRIESAAIILGLRVVGSE